MRISLPSATLFATCAAGYLYATSLIDAADAPALAVTLVGWHLESEPTRLVGVIEIQLTDVDRTIREELIKESEPVSGELPGNLATVAGRLLQRLASECITRMTTAARPGA